MTLREAQVLVLRVLKQVMEEKLDQHNVQLAQVRNNLPPSRRVILIEAMDRSLPTRAFTSWMNVH
jgi:ABC-type Fe3+-citrate transport system substrate-binding protein